MSLISRYRRGLRAAIGIAIVAFSVFPLSRTPGQSSKGRLLNPELELTDFNTTDSTWRPDYDASVSWHQLAPRQLPEYITLSIQDAKCRGEANLAQLNGHGNQKPVERPPSELDGWKQEVSEEKSVGGVNYPNLHKLFPNSENKVFRVKALQSSSYHDIHGVERVSSVGLRSILFGFSHPLCLIVFDTSIPH